MKLLQELVCLKEAVKPVEITTFTPTHGVAYISPDAWPEHVTYKGLNVFDVIYKNRPAELERAEKKLKSRAYDDSDYSNIQMQEVYLGYDVNSDTFIQGYDGWASIEDDYGDSEDVHASPFIMFKLSTDGKVSVTKTGLFMGTPEVGMWYGKLGGREALKKKMPGVIEIRLD